MASGWARAAKSQSLPLRHPGHCPPTRAGFPGSFPCPSTSPELDPAVEKPAWAGAQTSLPFEGCLAWTRLQDRRRTEHQPQGHLMFLHGAPSPLPQKHAAVPWLETAEEPPGGDPGGSRPRRGSVTGPRSRRGGRVHSSHLISALSQPADTGKQIRHPGAGSPAANLAGSAESCRPLGFPPPPYQGSL